MLSSWSFRSTGVRDGKLHELNIRVKRSATRLFAERASAVCPNFVLYRIKIRVINYTDFLSLHILTLSRKLPDKCRSFAKRRFCFPALNSSKTLKNLKRKFYAAQLVNISNTADDTTGFECYSWQNLSFNRNFRNSRSPSAKVTSCLRKFDFSFSSSHSKISILTISLR